MAFVCGMCECQACKMEGTACKEVTEICKKCTGNNPPKNKCIKGHTSKIIDIYKDIK